MPPQCSVVMSIEMESLSMLRAAINCHPEQARNYTNYPKFPLKNNLKIILEFRLLLRSLRLVFLLSPSPKNKFILMS